MTESISKTDNNEFEELSKKEVELVERNKIIEDRIQQLKNFIENIDGNDTESIENKNEALVDNSIKKIEEENENQIMKEFEDFSKKMTEENLKLLSEQILNNTVKDSGVLLKNISLGNTETSWVNLVQKLWKNKLLRYVTLSGGLAFSIATTYHSIPEYWSMWKNWKERHIDKDGKDDPVIEGIGDLYTDSTNMERSTYDFLGNHKIDYKSGYYMTSVFDLSDRSKPRFKLINDRENYTKIDSAAGITTNLFKKFYNYNDFDPTLKGHRGLGIDKIGDIPVIGYNKSTQEIKAGYYKNFNESWMVSETYEIPLNFKINPDSTLNLTYHGQALRMVPVTLNENGKEIPFPIGVSANKKITKIKPSDCVRFGTLEGGKVIIVCGEKQLQVNGSFGDMFRVYERLQKEYAGIPIRAYLLDNGSYNLPIWDKDSVITEKEIKEHLRRNYDGGTALVLINDGKISPYEYKNKYKEFEHYTPNFTLDSITKKPAVNEKSVIVIHHTADYPNPDDIIKQFENPESNTSSHVVIMKDGTRHLFNTDNYVLAHAGKSDFNNRNAVNWFSLGIEMEGNSMHGQQFTIAQLESLIEYLRPRIEKYKIEFENITTHKIIRDNYINKHPDSTKVQRKVDLDDKVWKQIQELIQKKLYNNKEKVDTITINGKKALGAISYQDAYRSMKDQKKATAEVMMFLKDQGLKNEELEEISRILS